MNEETPGQKWWREMNELRAKRDKEGLSKEEAEKLEFMEYKWEDWATDIEYSY